MNAPLIFEQTYKAPAEKVWQALTDKDQMKKWYFDVSDFKPVVGFEFTFRGENEGREFIHLCKVTVAETNKKLSYTWRYKDHQGISSVTWELFPEGDTTKLKLTHEGIESFPPAKDFSKESFTGGWTYILGTSLVKFLA